MGGLTNHLWQSTLFVVAAGMVTFTFRKSRAKVRYWLWFSSSCKFLVPFAVLMSLGSRLEWAPAAQKIAVPAVSLAIVQVSRPFPDTPPPAPSERVTRNRVPMVLFGLWACGFTGLAWMRLRSWLGIRAAVRASSRIDIAAQVEVRSAAGLLEPGIVGLWRPTMLLPAGITERLTPLQLEAVLAHELCHVRRQDNFTAAIQMLIEAVFWFHPLVWWIGARLVEERERACDEEVLRLGSEPEIYVEGILNVCKLYVESPLACMSGVTGSDLKKRITQILSGRVAGELNFARKAALAVAAMVALAAPILVGMLHAPVARGQSSKFEVASIKPGCGGGPAEGQRKGEKGGAGGSGRPTLSPDRLDSCASLDLFILEAYVFYPDGRETQPGGHLMTAVPVEGGPAWVHSDRYQINAKAESRTTREMMQGPMLRSLLEDRFKLRVRRETREVPAYALTAAKGGAKLRPFQPSSCFSVEDLHGEQPPPGQKFCLLPGPGAITGMTLDSLSTWLFAITERPVINRTGIAGRFDFPIEYAPDDSTPGMLRRLQMRPERQGGNPDDGAASDPVGRPTLFTALQQQFGLKLEPIKAPRDFIVIEHVERPTEN